VVGAALAVFGGPYVQGPPPLAPQAESRLSAVESLADNLDPTVRTAVEAAIEEVPSRDGAAIAAVAENVEALTATAAGLETQLTEVAGQLEALDSEVEQQFAAASAEVDEMITATREAASTEVAAAQTAFEAELETLRGNLSEARETATAEVAAAQTAFEAELEAVRGELAAAQTQLETVQSEVAGFQQARNRAAAAALLVRDIDQSIESGAPFAEPLERLIPMAAEDATLTTTLEELRGYAESGVPTMQALRDGLIALAETEATPEVAGSEFLGQAVQNLYGLVEVRSKADETSVAFGLLADADSALRGGDIESAIERVDEAVAAGEGVDADIAAAWLADARARLAAVDAQAQLDAHIRELLTATID
jgi:hypothetical protein